MTPELVALATLVGFQVVFGLAVTGLVASRAGGEYIVGSREETNVDLTSGIVGRMYRARLNNFEALAYFTPTIAILILADAATSTTAALAWGFVGTRLLFILCYALDLTPWRSIVWLIGIGIVATLLVLAFR